MIRDTSWNTGNDNGLNREQRGMTGNRARKRVLFLCHRIPYPPTKGDKIRSYRWLKGLVSRYDVRLAAFVDERRDFVYRDHLTAMGAEVALFGLGGLKRRFRALWGLITGDSVSACVYRDRRLGKWLARELQGGDVACVVIFSGALAQYVEVAHAGSDRVVLDFVDVDSEKWLQYAAHGGFLSGLYAREGRLLRQLECSSARVADENVFISREECELFAECCGDLRTLTWVGNGVDLDYFSTRGVPRVGLEMGDKAMVFVGVMSYKPNADGVSWFCDHVLPRVLAEHPNARFYVVGASPSRKVRRLRRRGVVVTGRVGDVRPYLSGAKVVVAPLMVGRGVQNKVLEGMAMSKPVVATPGAATGIGGHHGRCFLIAEAAEDFARQVCAVLDDQWPRLGDAAREFVQSHHCGDNMASELASLAASGTSRVDRRVVPKSE